MNSNHERSSMPEKWNKQRRQTTLRESDGRIVPKQFEDQSECDKPGNTGVGKAARISRDFESPPFAHSGELRCSALGFAACNSMNSGSRLLERVGRGSHPSDCTLMRRRAGSLFTLDVGEIWEPDAVTRHVRIYEGPMVNAARLKYCDTTTGNQWQTGNTNLNLNHSDLGLLSNSGGSCLLFKSHRPPPRCDRQRSSCFIYSLCLTVKVKFAQCPSD